MTALNPQRDDLLIDSTPLDEQTAARAAAPKGATKGALPRARHCWAPSRLAAAMLSGQGYLCAGCGHAFAPPAGTRRPARGKRRGRQDLIRYAQGLKTGWT